MQLSCPKSWSKKLQKETKTTISTLKSSSKKPKKILEEVSGWHLPRSKGERTKMKRLQFHYLLDHLRDPLLGGGVLCCHSTVTLSSVGRHAGGMVQEAWNELGRKFKPNTNSFGSWSEMNVQIILYITAKDCQRLQHVAFASLLLSPHHACKIMRDQKRIDKYFKIKR